MCRMAGDEDALPPFFGDFQSSTASSLVAWHRHQREQAFRAQVSSGIAVSGNVTIQLETARLKAEGQAGSLSVSVSAPAADIVATPPPEVVLSTLVDLGTKTDEGQLIIAVTPAWHAIVGELEKDPNALHRLLDSRQGEQLIAGAYQAHGWRVTLTPRSRDGGVDVIADATMSVQFASSTR
jgi:hypothetical protein